MKDGISGVGRNGMTTFARLWIKQAMCYENAYMKNND
jgi:hypothetical protein